MKRVKSLRSWKWRRRGEKEVEEVGEEESVNSKCFRIRDTRSQTLASANLEQHTFISIKACSSGGVSAFRRQRGRSAKSFNSKKKRSA